MLTMRAVFTYLLLARLLISWSVADFSFEKAAKQDEALEMNVDQETTRADIVNLESLSTRANGTTYVLHLTPQRTWLSGLIKCKEGGGQLASISNDEEYKILINLSKITALFGKRSPWIGAEDISEERNFIWIESGVSVPRKYFNNNTYPGKNTERNCVLLQNESPFPVQSWKCGRPRSIICKFKQ